MTRQHHGLPMKICTIDDLIGRLARQEAPIIPAKWDKPRARAVAARDLA